MSTRVQSYLCSLLVGLGLVVVGGTAYAQHIYLDPDSVFITSGAGTEFDLDLRVDASTQGIRLFQVLIAFDTSMVDTTATALGPLFASTSFMKIFNVYIYYDATYATTILRLEGLLFGATAVVNGPGIVAEVSLVTKRAGTVRLEILSHVMTDINNDPITSTAAGGMVLIDVPPSSFNLREPGLDEEVTIFADSNLHLIWGESESPYAAEGVEYTCELSTTSAFNAGATTTFAGLTDTFVNVPGTTLMLNRSYWFRVTAVGDAYGFERQSTPFGQSFYVKEPDKPPSFPLRSPDTNDSVFVAPGGSVVFVWGASASPYPEIEDLRYEFSYSDDKTFPPAGTIVQSNLAETTYTVQESYLTEGMGYWRVRAYGTVFGTEQYSIPNPDSFFFAIGAPPGEFHLTSPSDGGLTDVYGRATTTFDWSDAVSVIPGDTTTYTLTISGDPAFGAGATIFSGSAKNTSTMEVTSALLPLPETVYWKVKAENLFGFERDCEAAFSTLCFMRGDVTSAYGSINIGDLTFLVGFFFRGGASATPIEASDLNCDDGTRISDLTFLVSYLFRGGPGPYCP